MCAFLLPFLACSAALLPQDPPPPPPPPQGEQEVSPAEAAQAIADAFKAKDAALIEGVLKQHGRIADAAVVKEVGDGLKHAEAGVRLATVEALRFNTHEAALELLLKQKNNKRLHDDPMAAEAFALALGQKRDKRAIPLLKDGLVATGDLNNKVMTAKLYALGRIRDKESCEVLMDFLNSAQLRSQKYLGEIRTSMAVLTGVDAGKDRNDWLDWWRDNKAKLKIVAEEPPLPKTAGAFNWQRMWATPEEVEAWKQQQRGKDGGDDESGEKPPPKRERPPPGGGA